MTDIKTCKALKEAGYEQTVKPGEYYYDIDRGGKIHWLGDGNLIDRYEFLKIKEYFAIPTEKGLREWMHKEKNIEIIEIHSQACKNGEIEFWGMAESRRADVMAIPRQATTRGKLNALSALLDLLRKMGVI